MAMARFAPKPCGRADESEGFVGSKAVRTSGQERRLCRVKAVRASGQERRLCRVQSRAGERTRAKALPCPKPCGRERRLCRVKAVRTRAKALSGQSRADERTRAMAMSGQSRADERIRAKALSGQSRANERTGQEAEAKMGVILALRR